MWYVYIVRCNDGSLYTGVTNDLQKRINRHNDGGGARYTKVRRPVELLYKEPFSTKGEALKREIAVKNFSRKEKKRLVELCVGKITCTATR